VMIMIIITIKNYAGAEVLLLMMMC
jgi:hypothetical protein